LGASEIVLKLETTSLGFDPIELTGDELEGFKVVGSLLRFFDKL
jgi:hypothetical protein